MELTKEYLIEKHIDEKLTVTKISELTGNSPVSIRRKMVEFGMYKNLREVLATEFTVNENGEVIRK